MSSVARIITTSDGSHSLQSERFAASYHSVHGAIQESEHVFIQAALAPLAATQSAVRVLEMGFGTGLNAYLTWLYARQHQLNVYYETIEAYPITAQQADVLNYPTLLGASKGDFRRLHTTEWNQLHVLAPEFSFRKWSSTVQSASLSGAFDIVYYDAFAPSSQPELWEAQVLRIMYDALRPGGVFVTYCAKGVVKRCLRGVGFTVEGIPGPPGKREMTKATKP